jgi:hypothetical protein
MAMPNFLILGAAKAGTTSLYHYLQQHPNIYMSPLKEPKFFALEGQSLDFRGPSQLINQTSVTTLADYQALFASVGQESAIGEASPVYLYYPETAGRIARSLPQVKLIAILRDPVDRAFSSYSHLVREGFEPLEFGAALAAETERIQDRWAPLWYYQAKGFYYEQLKRYTDLFPTEQIKIYLFEDLCCDPLAVVQDIYTFVGVDPTFVPDMAKRNVSGVPKNRTLQTLLTRDNPVKTVAKTLMPKRFRRSLSQNLQARNLGSKLELDPQIEQRLRDLYAQDVRQLQDLIQRDLSAWLAPTGVPT